MKIGGTFDAHAAMAALSKKAAEIDKVSALALKRAGLVVERAAKEKLSEQGRHEKGTPTPSQPGQPPSIITSALRASVKTGQPDRKGFGSYEVLVGPTITYGRVQELGGGPKGLPARPYMAPAWAESADKAQAELVRVWKEALF